MTRMTCGALAVVWLAGCDDRAFNLDDASASSRRGEQVSWASLQRGGLSQGAFSPRVPRSVRSIELWFSRLVDIEASREGIVLEDDNGEEVPTALELRGPDGIAVTFDTRPEAGVTWRLAVTREVRSWSGDPMPFDVVLTMPVRNDPE